MLTVGVVWGSEFSVDVMGGQFVGVSVCLFDALGSVCDQLVW